MPLIKFDFVPERQVGKDLVSPTYSVSIYPQGTLIFSREVMDIYELEGKYLRLFADVEKKTIGWSIVEGKTDLDVINDARLLKANKGGVGVLGITKLLSRLGIEKRTAFKNLQVKLYKSPLNSYDIWYIKLEKEV